jgi:hypothetical protein
MYALIHNSQLILGPIKYNYRLINGEIEELEIDYQVSPRDYDNVPITIDAATKTYLIPAVEIIPEYDPRFQLVNNSEWDIVEENDIPVRVEFSYSISDKTLEQVKEEYKSQVAPERWNKENTTVTVTLYNREITVSTSRENRLAIVSKVVSDGGVHNYKFNDGEWVEILKDDLVTILNAIDNVVQAAFDWEYAKLTEIDACTTKEDVYNVILREPPQQP